MRFNILIFIAWIISISASGQKLYFLNADGSRYKRACKNIADINRDFPFPIKVKVVSTKPVVTVGYKLFTAEMAWIQCDETVSVDQIESFDITAYFMSCEFESD